MIKESLKYILLPALIACYFLPWQVVLVIALIFSLFFFTHLKYHNLKLETFAITAKNKEPMTPMSWYRDEIMSQMTVLRWRLVENTPEKKVWMPRGQSRVMENSFTMTYSPYEINISGSRNMIAMMKSFLDLEKIFI